MGSPTRSSRSSRRSTVGGRRENQPPPTAYRLLPTHQEGFTLAALIVIMTIISIIVAFTVPPQWSMLMHRERDKQTIFQMKQAARAISIWQAKHQGFPTTLDQLKEAKQPRVLRFSGDSFPMPLTGKEEDWILVPESALEPAQPIVQPNAPPNTPPAMPPSKLREGASPAEYEGPFIGVRPNKSGKSFIALNGAEDYSQWVYTTRDLQTEVQGRLAAINLK